MFTSSDIYQNTCLGSIINDLRPIIDMYIDYYSPFAVGVANKKYSGYRLVTEDDFKSKTFCTSIVDYYKKHNGLRSLDNFEGLYLCGDGIDIYKSGVPMKVYGARGDTPTFICRDSIVRLHKFKYMKCGARQPYNFDVGLFILVGHVY